MVLMRKYWLPENSDNFSKIFSNSSQIKFNLFNSFGIDELYFDRDNFLFKKSFLTFVSKWGSGKTSQIKNVEAIPFEGIIIETEEEVYRFGKKLTESERDWLVQEIKHWLRNP
jgi:hypothetical protein